MHAGVLNDEIRVKIPPLYSQESTADPIVYARLFSPGSKWQCFVTEGRELNGTFVIFGLFVGSGSRWGQIELTELAQMLDDEGAKLCVDREFKPIHLSALPEVREIGSGPR